MRLRIRAGVLLIGCSGVLVGTLGVAAVAAKPPPKKLQVSCTATAYNVDFPQLSGPALAQLNCTKPFGAGVQLAHNTTTIVGSTVNVSGSFKNFFDDGTDSGTVKLSGPFGTGAITATGSVTITGGTGAYKHIKGKGAVTCTTPDAGKTFHCTVKGTTTL
jgi:hypothetical protein